MKLSYFFKSDWALSAIRVALVVGTILFAINHGSALLEGSMTGGRWVSVLLSYLVPYCVYIIGRASSRKGIAPGDHNDQ